MTLNQKINQLKVLHDTVTDKRQQDALNDAIILMQSRAEFYTIAYMRGYHDARNKGEEA